MNVHFLNVGHGDTTIIEFNSGRMTMVDINNGSKVDEESKKEILDELGLDYGVYQLTKMLNPNVNFHSYVVSKGYDIQLTNPIEWLEDSGATTVFRFVSTHPDMDHLSGLNELFEHNDIQIVNFWDVSHNFTKSENDEGFSSGKFKYADWVAYEKCRSSSQNPKCINPLRGHSQDYWVQDGISILSPDDSIIEFSHKSNNTNHLSYVLLIQHGLTKVYLCGDATNDNTLPGIIEHYGEDYFKKKSGETVILKAPHHGRNSGYHSDFVNLLDPDAVIVSVGKKPNTDASNKYRNHSDNVWSTRWKGNISLQCRTDGRCIYEFEYNR